MSKNIERKKMPELLVVNESLSNDSNILLDIMKKEQDDRGLVMIDLDFSYPCGTGDNYMSLIKRAKIKVRRSNGNCTQKSFIIKTQLKDDGKKMTLMANEVWNNEIYMFNNLLPALSYYSGEKLPIPKFYYGDPHFIIVEDLCERGYVMGERVCGFGMDQTKVVLNELARLHTSSLAMQYKDAKSYKVLKEAKHPYDTEESLAKVDPFIKKSIMDAIKILEGKCKKKYNNAISILAEIANNQSKHLPNIRKPFDNHSAVIIHGDMWINNIMISYDPISKKPMCANFIDFQCSRMGASSMDLHHLLYTSVEPGIRRYKLEYILKCYYQYFENHLNNYLPNEAEEYKKIFTHERFLNEFRHYRMYGLLNAIFMLPGITVDSKSETFDFLKLDANNNTIKFKERLLDVVDEFIERDWMSLN